MTLQTGFLETVSGRARNSIVGGLRRLGFWGSVLLPVTYLHTLYATNGADQLFTLGLLVGLNLLCLVFGRDYAQ